MGFLIGYKLHKDGSPVVDEHPTQEEHDKAFKELKDDGYSPQTMIEAQANTFLFDWGKQFEPKPLTQEERWRNWAVGN